MERRAMFPGQTQAAAGQEPGRPLFPLAERIIHQHRRAADIPATPAAAHRAVHPAEALRTPAVVEVAAAVMRVEEGVAVGVDIRAEVPLQPAITNPSLTS